MSEIRNNRILALPNPKNNHILGALPTPEYMRLLPYMELVLMPSGWTVFDSSQIIKYVYFPTSCIFSILHLMEDGSSGEVASIGNEGLAGIGWCMGGRSMLCRTVVQNPGHCYRIKASILKFELDKGGKLQQLTLLYAQLLMAQMSQISLCNRRHSVDQQFCRDILWSLDRISGSDLAMTHALLASMLGVRRESVTEAACHLQQDGLIAYRRGHITVINRPKLETRACECYSVLKDDYDLVLPYRKQIIASRLADPQQCCH